MLSIQTILNKEEGEYVPIALRVDELAEWIIESMDISTIENYAIQFLKEYYMSPEGEDDFHTNWAEMMESISEVKDDESQKEDTISVQHPPNQQVAENWARIETERIAELLGENNVNS